MQGRCVTGLHYTGLLIHLSVALRRITPYDGLFPYRHLSTGGLLSIVSNHGKKKTKPDAPKDPASQYGILGKIGTHRRKPDPSSSTPLTNGANSAGHGVNGSRLDGDRRLGNAPTNVVYDDRWAKLINPRHKNGTKASDTRQPAKPTSQQTAQEIKPTPKLITISEDITPKLLAHKLGVSVVEVERVLSNLGEAPQSSEDQLSLDAAEVAALEFGVHVSISKSRNKAEGETVSRPPVVTVMGHVDHGKTSLLDSLRKTSVALGEAGGITQHIGAFEVAVEGSEQSLTFLDTPGHAAFSAMRAHGAQATDIVVLVIAADDGIMPQTKECLELIKQTSCPFVVAITKCDLPQADAQKIKGQLGSENIPLEEFGGTVQVVEVSSVSGQGLTDLQDALLLQAAAIDLQARLRKPAAGVVVEANKCKGLGPAMTVIVTEGCLKVGSPVVVGHHWGRIRQMKCPNGEILTEVLPGKPAEVSGIRGVPNPGDELMVVCSEDRAKRVSSARELKHNMLAKTKNGSLETSNAKTKQVNFLVKTDTQGTSEAVLKAISTLSSEVISPHVLSHAVGNISEADIMFAEAADCHILGFNVKLESHEILTLAQQKHIHIAQHSIIYELLDTVGEILVESAVPCEDEEHHGEAIVQQVFGIKCKRSKTTQNVAGCLVKSGFIRKSSGLFRLLRNKEIIFEGVCASLKRHKLDVDRVGKGTECGILLEDFNTPQQGDVIQYLTKVKRQPKTEIVVGGGKRVIEFANVN